MIERLRQRDKAMIALILGVTAYELSCKDNETISEWFDPFMEKKSLQALATIIGGIGVAHIANLFPEDKDLFQMTLSPIRQAVRRRIE